MNAFAVLSVLGAVAGLGFMVPWWFLESPAALVAAVPFAVLTTVSIGLASMSDGPAFERDVVARAEWVTLLLPPTAFVAAALAVGVPGFGWDPLACVLWGAPIGFAVDVGGVFTTYIYAFIAGES